MVTAYIPRRSANAETLSKPKVKGSNNTIPIPPPSPGITPIKIPLTTPANKYPNVGH